MLRTLQLFRSAQALWALPWKRFGSSCPLWPQYSLHLPDSQDRLSQMQVKTKHQQCRQYPRSVRQQPDHSQLRGRLIAGADPEARRRPAEYGIICPPAGAGLNEADNQPLDALYGLAWYERRTHRA